MSGNSTMSYWSATGTVAGNAGSIASNGDITSTGSANINGTVYTLPGAKVSSVVAKSMKTLSAPLSYPDGDASPYSKTVNDNGLIPAGYVNNTPDFNIGSGKSVTIPSGNYVFNNFTMSGGRIGRDLRLDHRQDHQHERVVRHLLRPGPGPAGQQRDLAGEVKLCR
jgi:hypothetical protein